MTDSSVIKCIDYDADTGETTVEFHTGTVYTYEGISFEIVDNWIKSKSLGVFFHENIKNNFRYSEN